MSRRKKNAAKEERAVSLGCVCNSVFLSVIPDEILSKFSLYSLILVKVRDDHDFAYADEKCIMLAKKIKELVDDKARFADWSTRDDIKNQLNMDLTVLLYQNGYPPEWDEEVFEKVMEQAENFKKYSVQ